MNNLKKKIALTIIRVTSDCYQLSIVFDIYKIYVLSK